MLKSPLCVGWTRLSAQPAKIRTLPRRSHAIKHTTLNKCPENMYNFRNPIPLLIKSPTLVSTRESYNIAILSLLNLKRVYSKYMYPHSKQPKGAICPLLVSYRFMKPCMLRLAHDREGVSHWNKPYPEGFETINDQKNVYTCMCMVHVVD